MARNRSESKHTSVLEAWGRLDPLEPCPTEAIDSLRLSRAQISPRRALAFTNPVTRPEPGLITRATPVGSMGSCFSTRIRDWLVRHGYNYVCAEPEPRALDETVFPGGWVRHTARFGVVYNTASARQILQRALGRFDPAEPAWEVDYLGTRILRDPYRSGVAWADEEDMRRELSAHRLAVRRAVGACSVFIVTAGLTEIWRSRLDGAVFAEAPPAGVHDPARHAFELSSVEDNIRNLEGVYDALREINPSIRLVLALSPMRYKATYRRVHWAVGNTVSKSVLRVAIDRFCEAHPEVIYFPSYEIVTGMLTEDAYEPDAKHLKLKHIERVMVSFMSAYGDPDEVREALGGRMLAEVDAIEFDQRDLDADRARAAQARLARVTGDPPAARMFFRQVWRDLGARYGEAPVVLVGGGLHTERLAFAVHASPGPRVLAVLDDHPRVDRIGPWPVRRFDAVDPGGGAAAVISTDSIGPTLEARARAWIGEADTRVERLYDDQALQREDPVAWLEGKTGRT